METKQIEITKYEPCKDAVVFREGFKTFKQAWEACPRGDWMLWIAQKAGVNIRTLTLAKALCAETIIHLVKDKRSLMAIEAAKQFGLGKIDKKELQDAATVAATVATTTAYVAYATTTTTTDAAAAARTKNRLETANICRDILTKEILIK